MTTTTLAPRWPLRTLLTATATPSFDALASLVGVSSRTLWRWQRDGLTDRQADHAAIALGLHPASIWPDWFHAAPSTGR